MGQDGVEPPCLVSTVDAAATLEMQAAVVEETEEQQWKWVTLRESTQVAECMRVKAGRSTFFSFSHVSVTPALAVTLPAHS